jgi:cell division protease FtsH
VAKVTILPRGAALRVTEQLPEFERHLYPESYLTDALAVRLGGRASEILILNEASTGASNDLADATSIATRMIRERGFSAEVGPIGYGPEGPSRDNPFAGPPLRRGNATGHRPRLLREAEQRATELLSAHRSMLDQVIGLLLERETIKGAELAALLGIPEHHADQEQIWAPRAVAMASGKRLRRSHEE